MKTKREIIEQNNLNHHMIQGYEVHADKPLLTIIFTPRDKHENNFRLHFNRVNGKELDPLEVRFDTWSGEDVGPAVSAGQGEKIKRKPKQRKKPKRIEKKGPKTNE